MVKNVVIMAAGKGTRMRSARPKVLHMLAGKSLLQHVLDAVAGLGASEIIVVTGHGAAVVEAAVGSAGAVRFARQEPQLGTGHALQQALPLLAAGGSTLVLNGDVPLIGIESLRSLIALADEGALALLTVALADPHGYGRVVREAGSGNGSGGGSPDGDIVAIVEEKDASPAERAIAEIYTGVLAAPTDRLVQWLGRLRNDNAAGEYYLTDVVALAVADETPVRSAAARSETEVLGVNSPVQLADLERRHQRTTALALMEAGVRLADPGRLDVRGELVCGSDVEIDAGCIFEGRVELGDGVRIGAHCVLRNASVAAGATIRPFTHIDGEALGASIGAGAIVGPYARLRGGARLGQDVHVGNFVEVKNASLGAGSKANHLAYVGDASLGERVNFGAGAITANYDGANKHLTTIHDDVHVGSNCVLVAPIEVGAGATIGAGSTVGKDVPGGGLTVARARQASFAAWRRPVKRRE